jgi:hypothetical protein
MRVALLLTPLAMLACSFDWNAFDPRLGAASASSTAVTSATGATTGAGGAGATGGGSPSGGGGSAPLGPFDTPQPVAALSDAADDDDPTFTADLLELYFNSARITGEPDVWKSQRSSATDPWGPPVAVPELSSIAFDSNFLIAPDGLTFWLSSERDGQGMTDIFVSSRATRTSAWSTPALVIELNSPSYENVSGILPNGLLMLVDRGDQLHLSTRASLTTPWSPLAPIAELNASPYNSDGWLSPDALTIYFTSDRTGNIDLYVTTRLTDNGVFAEPTAILELNSSEADSDPFLSPDARYIMFSRSVSGGPREIYEASR